MKEDRSELLEDLEQLIAGLLLIYFMQCLKKLMYLPSGQVFYFKNYLVFHCIACGSFPRFWQHKFIAAILGKVLHSSKGKLVSHTIYRFYVIATSCLQHFFTQVFNMGINKVIVIGHIHIITPQIFRYGSFTNHFIFVADKI